MKTVLFVLALAAVHEVLRRSLAGDAIVSALFAPSGPHTYATLALGLLFLGVRTALFVGVPGWLGARAIPFAYQRRRVQRAANLGVQDRAHLAAHAAKGR